MLRYLSFFVALMLALPVIAQERDGPLRIEITEGVIEPVPIAVAPFIAENACLLYTSPSPRDLSTSRMPSSA